MPNRLSAAAAFDGAACAGTTAPATIARLNRVLKNLAVRMVLHSSVAPTARFAHWAESIRARGGGFWAQPARVPTTGRICPSDAAADRDAFVSENRPSRRGT